MDRGTMLPEMLHCTEMTVLEWQRARLKWQHEEHEHEHQHQQQQQQEAAGYFSELSQLISQGYAGGLIEQQGEVKPEPDFQNGWPAPAPSPTAVYGFGPGFEASSYSIISRTSSCPPAVDQVKGKQSPSVATAAGRESFKKRKADKMKAAAKEEEEARNKRMKGSAEEGDSKTTERNSNTESTSADTSKAASEVQNQKPDYIHVRARRGQATDSHSLAERVRREKISERMKYLQDLVPGCNKITGKAGMLDEIINYVQSLQRQVEFLSMKLAAVDPRLDFNLDSFAKEAFPGFPTIGVSAEMANPAAYLHHFNSLQQQQQQEEQVMGINPTDIGLRRTISAPVSVPPEQFLDSSCYPQLQSSSNWDTIDLQNFYNVASSFPSHPFTGAIEASDLKVEM